MSKVSVLLTAYNSKPEWLRKAVYSVMGQDYPVELILLDDNSDRLYTVEEEFNLLNEFSEIIFYKSNVKPSERMNTTRYATLINVGLKISSGDYIGYLTDDDFYLPGRLKVMVDKIESDDNIQVVYGRQHLYQYNDKIGERFHGQVLDSAACLVDHCSVLHTRWITHTVGMWDDNPSNWGAADASYWTEISKNGFKFYPVDYPTDVHRFHSDSVQARLTRGESDLN